LRARGFSADQSVPSRAIVVLIFSGLAASNCKIGDLMEVWTKAADLLHDRHLVMKTNLRFVLLVAWLLPLAAFAQGRGPGTDFKITKITRSLISAPQFAYTGGQSYQTDQRDRWLQVEVEFTATPELTDELTFKYYILFNGSLLTGEVTHVNIPAGRENRSVMYVPPRVLARFANNRPITENSCQNVAVQIVQQGTVKAETSLNRAAPQWFAILPQVSGFVMDKNQTPFAPLYWDRYEQIQSR
jgi:hypothetical protein